MTDDEQPELPKSPIKVSDLQEEMQRFVRLLYDFLRVVLKNANFRTVTET